LNVKKLLTIALLLAGFLPASSARAQVFGQYAPAEVLSVNSRLAGAYVGLSENVVGMLAQLRLSFHPNVDFGFQGGLARFDANANTKKTMLQLGADFRFGVARVSERLPVDVAAGAGLGVETSDKYHVLRFGPMGVASRTFAMSPSASIAPYAGVMLSFASRDLGGSNDTDFSIPIRFGAELRAIPGVRVTAELQLRLGDDFNDHTAFAGGVNLPF
jgi:hypothetical protein